MLINYSHYLCWALCGHSACSQGNAPKVYSRLFFSTCDLLVSEAITGGLPSVQRFTMHSVVPCLSCVRSVELSGQPLGD